jgi:hypothetical protein
MVIANSIAHYLKHVLHPNYFLHGIDFGFEKWCVCNSMCPYEYLKW